MIYARPLVQSGPKPDEALLLTGGPLWFSQAEVFGRDTPPRFVSASALPFDLQERLTEQRAPIAGLDPATPQIMGILNTTPDSFSDGGQHSTPDAALRSALAMVEAGATLVDVGGESTRPGADYIDVETETARTAPVIAALRAQSVVPISIDTRKAEVAAAAVKAGANVINDVSGFTHDLDLADVAARASLPVCIMHAQGDPATMQDDPQYDNVCLDVYDFLAARIDALEAQGIARARMIVDPGIGFGKTVEHNLQLLRNISLFHGLGVPILLGVSRKGFIGKLGQAPDPTARAPGSVAVGLAALAQGVHILRVHDVAETAQALRLWQAVTT